MKIVSPSEQIKSLAFAHSAATTSKLPIVIGGKALIPLSTALANVRNTFVYDAVVTEAPKAASQAWAVNAALYWDATAGNFTTTSTGNTLCGHVGEAADSAATVSGAIVFDSYASA